MRWAALGLLVWVTSPATAQELVPGSGIEAIYITTFAHADVGFNAPPSVMSQNNHDRTVAALDLAQAHPDFRWTVETTHQLQDFLTRASPEDLKRFEYGLGTGQLGVGAGYLNLHTGLCGEEEVRRQAYEAATWLDPLGYQPKVAMLNDVPGMSSSTPRVFANAGVPYAILSANNAFGGKPDIPIADRPFWWTAKDGSRMLSWPTYDDAAYMEGWYVWGLGSVAGAEANLPAILRDFESNGYPYDALLVPYASDNNDPFTTLHDVVADWNARYDKPRLILAQPEAFFDHLLDTYGDVFPEYRGDASGTWEDVSTTSPVSTSLVRGARSRLAQAEALWAQRVQEQGGDYPHEDTDRAWHNAMRLDEHSGAGAGWPGLLTAAEIQQENEEFLTIAHECASTTDGLLTDAAGALAAARVPAGEQALVVFNPIGEAFDGVLEVTLEEPLPEGVGLVDGTTGEPVPLQWLDGRRDAMAIWVSVPAYGWKRLDAVEVKDEVAPPAWVPGEELTAGDARLRVGSDGTVTSWVDLSTGAEWIPPATDHGFGGLEAGTNTQVFFSIYERIALEGLSLSVDEGAGLFSRVKVESPGGDLLAEYRLYAEERRVDATLWLDRAALPFVPYAEHSRHYAASFPVDLSLPTRLFLDGPDGEYEPATESLPGAGLGSFGVATGARLEGADGRWASVASLDTPILNLGEMTGAFTETLESDENALTYKLLRHHTEGLSSDLGEFEVEAEPGATDRLRYRFRIRLGEAGDPAPARSVLLSDLAPPVAAWVSLGTGASPAATGEWVSVEGDATVAAIKGARWDTGGMIVRLRAGESGGAVTLHHPHRPSTAWRTDLAERPLEPLTAMEGAVEVPLVPHEVVTVWLSDFAGLAPPGDTGTAGTTSTDTTPDLDETGTPGTDTGGDSKTQKKGPGQGEGCGCSSSAGLGSPAWLAVLWGFALGVRRRSAR